MTIRNRVRYCDRCGKSLRGHDWMNAARLDFHWPECPPAVLAAIQEVDGNE